LRQQKIEILFFRVGVDEDNRKTIHNLSVIGKDSKEVLWGVDEQNSKTIHNLYVNGTDSK